mmetsp:Transcript_10879/g.45674  ORF Transcript_10879/g.45674 Transcript_10879/m.45674 type:complete len:216 (-) Transcript_10879:458-1105(-)
MFKHLGVLPIVVPEPEQIVVSLDGGGHRVRPAVLAGNSPEKNLVRLLLRHRGSWGHRLRRPGRLGRASAHAHEPPEGGCAERQRHELRQSAHHAVAENEGVDRYIRRRVSEGLMVFEVHKCTRCFPFRRRLEGLLRHDRPPFPSRRLDRDRAGGSTGGPPLPRARVPFQRDPHVLPQPRREPRRAQARRRPRQKRLRLGIRRARTRAVVHGFRAD